MQLKRQVDRRKIFSIILTLALLLSMLLPAAAQGASITLIPSSLTEGYPNGQAISV